MDRRDHRGPGCRSEPEVQGEQVSELCGEPIYPSAGMITQCVGDFVDYQVRSDESNVSIYVALAKREGGARVRLRQIPLRRHGCVYDGRLRSRQRRISFVLLYSLRPI